MIENSPVGVGVPGERGRDEDRGEHRAGEQRRAELLEHDGDLGQCEALAAVLLCDVEPQPALRRHLLPHRWQLRRERGRGGRGNRLGERTGLSR